MKIAFVFPGQGSQSLGMFNGFADNATVVGALREASAAIDTDLLALAADGPAEQLALTTYTQPIMLAAGVAFYRAWLAAGGAQPSVVAGHSLGEYSALTAAGAFELTQAVRLVRFRAEAMQDAVPAGVGAMAAVLGLDRERVGAVCLEAAQGEVVEPVNYNEPLQTVIAGHAGAVDRACMAAKAAGAKRAIVLPVSAPFHSRLMRPAAQRLAERLSREGIAMPGIDVIHNVDVSVAASPEDIRAKLVEQAARAVQWVDTVRAMQARGITHVVECGPGKVLGGLVKRIASDLQVFNIFDAATLDATLAALKG